MGKDNFGELNVEEKMILN